MLIATIQSRARRKKGPIEFLQQDELSRLLFRERERADRNHHAFCMVVFDVGEMTVKLFRQFADVLLKRRRGTDEIGWFDKNELGVILAESGSKGANSYLEDLRELLKKEGIKMPESKVFLYRGNVEGEVELSAS